MSHGYSLRPRGTHSSSSPSSTTSSTPASSSSSAHHQSSTSSPLRPSTPPHSTLYVPSTNLVPVSPTKRKLDDTSSDEDEYGDHIGSASDKLHEFHKVKISSRTESEVRDTTKQPYTPITPLQLELPDHPLIHTPPQSSPQPLQHTNSSSSSSTLTRTSSSQEQPISPPVSASSSTHPHQPSPAPTLTYAPSTWGYITSKGGRKENQDFYTVPHEEMIDAKSTNTALVFGVFDGHGTKGHDAARECGRCINAHFATNNARTQTQEKTQEWVDNALRDAFRNAQDTLLQIEAKNKHVLDYGTTACVAVIRPAIQELTIAWVGDARAAVVRWETVVSTPRIPSDDTDTGSGSGGSGLSEKASTFIYNNSSNLINSPTTNNNNNNNSTNTSNNNNNTTTTTTTTTGSGEHTITRASSKGSNHEDAVHSPFLTSESAPGSPASSTTTVEDISNVQPTLQLVELTTDHVPQREDERARVLQQGGVIRKVGNVVRVVAGGNYTEEQLKQQRLALNITRSLGHAILSQFGISAEPDVLKTTIQTDDILLIASDGLWNELSSSEISAIALECKMAGFSPQKFCNMLLRRAEVVSKLKGISADNITIVVYHHTF